MNTEATDTVPAADAAEQGAYVAPEKAPSKQGATPKKEATRGRQTAHAAKANQRANAGKRPKAGKKPSQPTRGHAAAPRAGSKGAKILALIGRAKGATLAEIRKVTHWQAHSVRAFLSTAAKKHRAKIQSAKNAAGDRVYRAKEAR